MSTHEMYGRARESQALKDYTSPDEYADQGDKRVVKHLMFTYHVLAPSPTFPGQEIIQERVATRGQVVYTDELGPMYLEKGERLDAFFTTEELNALSKSGTSPAALPQVTGPITVDDDQVSFSELGEHEMVEYLETHQPNVNDTIALAGDDPNVAKRLLEAENIYTSNDPRKGVVDGLARIVSQSQ